MMELDFLAGKSSREKFQLSKRLRIPLKRHSKRICNVLRPLVLMRECMQWDRFYWEFMISIFLPIGCSKFGTIDCPSISKFVQLNLQQINFTPGIILN